LLPQNYLSPQLPSCGLRFLFKYLPPKTQNQKIYEGDVCFESRNLIVFFIKLIERCLAFFFVQKEEDNIVGQLFSHGYYYYHQ